MSAPASATPPEPAASAPSTAPSTPWPISVTVGGGVSLGAYQAGFLYYLSEVAKAERIAAHDEGHAVRGVVAPAVTSAHAGALSAALPLGGGAPLAASEAGLVRERIAASSGAPFTRVVLATGASAGTINALLALIDSCSNTPVPDATRSLFWQSWLDVGFNQLFSRKPVPGTTSASAGLSNAALLRAASVLRHAWLRIPKGCDVVFVGTTTRLKPLPIEVTGLGVVRAEEKFALRIQGTWVEGAKESGPIVTNYQSPTANPPASLLDLPTRSYQENHREPAVADRVFEAIVDLLLASSAFPGAFPAHDIKHCLSGDPRVLPDQAEAKSLCGRALRVDPFVDGGVFDNTPLRVAYKTVRDGLDPTPGVLGWRQTPALSNQVICDAAHAGDPRCRIGFVFVDKDNAAYPGPPEDALGSAGGAASRDTLLSYLASFVTTGFDSATAKELYTLAEEDPSFGYRVGISKRYLPTASGHLANFLGFFEKSFREFDFYLGMYDAEQYLSEKLYPRLREERKRVIRLKESGRFAHLRCIEGVLDGDPGGRGSCPTGSDPRSAAFRILLQTSIDRLYDQCARLGKSPPTSASASATAHSLCRWAILHPAGPRPTVPGIANANEVEWRAKPAESAFEHMMRLLAAYDFTFADLAAGPVPASQAMPLIRDKLAQVASSLAARQPTGLRILGNVVSKAAVNFFYYAPPLHILYTDVGRGLDIGYSLRLSERRWFPLRLDVVTEIKGFLGAENWRGSFTQLAGLAYELPLPRREIVVVRAHGRAGVQFAPWFAQCTDAEFARTYYMCHALVVQPGFSVAFFDRLRLHFSGEYLNPTPFHAGVTPRWTAVYGGGVQMLW